MAQIIIGAGYTATFLYQRLKENSVASPVYTLSRASSFLDNPGHITADLDKPKSLDKLHTIQADTLTIYYLAPPKAEGLHESRVHNFIQYLHTLKNVETKIVYISTSGVYGNRNGDWVTEETPTKPINDRAKRRVSAEKQLLSAMNKTLHSIILRVPGIYGQGRLPIEKIKQRGKIISEAECGYTNLIHVEDLVTVCIAAAKKGKAGDIYNVSDTHAVKSSYYYKLVAKLAGLTAPEEVSYATALATFDSKRLSFLTESRRLNVNKLLENLQPELLYTKLENGVKQAITS